MKKDKIRIKPVRLAGYLFLLFVDIALYIMLHSYFLWIFMIFLFILPFFSFCGMKMLAKKINIKLYSINKYINCDDDLFLFTIIENKIWWGALNSRINLNISNSFFGDETSIDVSGSILIHGESKWKMPFVAKDPGRYYFSLNSIVIRDILAIFDYEKNIEAECEVFCMPNKLQINQPLLGGFSTEKTSENESNKKGSDFSEVSDIREYKPGDRIRDIHWKLSSKQEKLMVKERIQVSGSEIVLLYKPCQDRKENIALLSNLYGLINYFVEENENVRYLFWNDASYEFNEYICDDENNMIEIFAEIMSVNVLNRTSENIDKYLKNFYPHLTAYVILTMKEGKMSLEVVDNV